MTTQIFNLAAQAVASPHWLWMPGMLLLNKDRAVRVSVLAKRESFWLDEGWKPDLSDPATIGCITFLVRSMWGEHAVTVANGFEDSHNIWSLHCGIIEHNLYGHEISKGSSEIEALLKGLNISP